MMTAAGARSTAARLHTDVVVAIPGAGPPADAVRAGHRCDRGRTVRAAIRSASADAVSLRRWPRQVARVAPRPSASVHVGVRHREVPDEDRDDQGQGQGDRARCRGRGRRRLGGTPSQSANEAPSGRVTM